MYVVIALSESKFNEKYGRIDHRGTDNHNFKTVVLRNFILTIRMTAPEPQKKSQQVSHFIDKV